MRLDNNNGREITQNPPTRWRTAGLGRPRPRAHQFDPRYTEEFLASDKIHYTHGTENPPRKYTRSAGLV